VHAHRQIQRARKTEWLPLTLLIGIPLIIGPFFFVFIAGDFGQALAAFLTGAAIIRLLENNLPLPTYIKKIGQQVPISQLAVAK
jgi:vacuolar-type H+-ATPase subunit I/STV1